MPGKNSAPLESVHYFRSKMCYIAGTCRFLCEVHKLEESPHDCEVTKTLESHYNQVSKQSDS